MPRIPTVFSIQPQNASTNQDFFSTLLGVTSAIQIVGSYSHSCALLESGRIKCWGYNGFGELSTGAPNKSFVPAGPVGVTNVAAVAVGSGHACVIVPGGSVQCWGSNSYGQLGNGGTVGSFTPIVVANVSGATALVAGSGHTCALVAGGLVQCWGSNTHGQLGNATSGSTPVLPVYAAGVVGATAITAGGEHTCALLAGGTMKCWGAGFYGELGNGGNVSQITSPSIVNGISGATAIAAGSYHTCALLADGTGRCWGINQGHQLGNGTQADSLVPVVVLGLTNGTALDAAGNDTCAIVAGGSLKCWGGNPSGGSSITNAVSLSVGQFHTCVATSAGTAKCWGDNSSGQLGNGTTTNSSSAVDVTGLVGVSAIGAEGLDSCALLSSGTVTCWGDNQSGVLGTNPGWAPVDVSIA